MVMMVLLPLGRGEKWAHEELSSLVWLDVDKDTRSHMRQAVPKEILPR